MRPRPAFPPIRSGLGLLLLLVSLGGRDAHAATITVIRYNISPGCHLREAITSANTDSNVGGCVRQGSGSADIILLPAEYIDGNPGTAAPDYDDEEGNVRGDYDVTSDITIQGVSTTQSAVAAPALDRLFDVHPGGTLRLRDVTLFGGSVVASAAPHGGAVRKHSGATLTLERVLLHGGVSQRGGGIHADVTSGSVQISDSTLRGGYATVSGGAVHLQSGAGSPPVSLLRNATLSGNSAGRGGALFVERAPLQLRNTTIARNQTLHPTYAAVELLSLAAADVGLTNSLLVDNGNAASIDANLRCEPSATIGQRRHSIVRGTVDCTVLNETGTPPGEEARLMPLFDYGGGIPVHALDGGSAARDAGLSIAGGGCPLADARGVARDAPCDIGAYEHHIDLTVDSFADLPDLDPGDGLCRASGNVCTLRAATMEAGARGGRWLVGLPAGTYTLSRPTQFNQDPAGGDLDVQPASLDIPPLSFHLFGLGTPADTHLVGSGSDRVLEARGTFYDPVEDAFEDRWLAFSLHNVTVRGGHLTEDPFRSQYESLAGGGVMLSGGNTLLHHVVIRDNALRPAEGGGAGGGVGIWVPRDGFGRHLQAQSARMERFSVIDNLAESAAFGATPPQFAFAGGIHARGPDLEYNDDGISLVNGLVADNRADAFGGIYATQKTYLAFLTVTGNRARAAQAGVSWRSGGVAFAQSGNRVLNSIFTGNHDGDDPRDCSTALGSSSTLTSLGHLLFGNVEGCSIDGDLTGNGAGIDVGLGPRETTPTGLVVQRLRADSPAQQAIAPLRCVDDRGLRVARDLGGDPRPLSGQCAVGASEGVAAQIELFRDGFE